MHKSKRGYRQQNNYLYELNILNKVYSVEVDVTWFIKPADSSSWDSDLDFAGYTEIEDTEITNIFTENENGEVIEVQFSQLSNEVQKEINAALDVMIAEENPEGEPEYDE